MTIHTYKVLFKSSEITTVSAGENFVLSDGNRILNFRVIHFKRIGKVINKVFLWCISGEELNTYSFQVEAVLVIIKWSGSTLISFFLQLNVSHYYPLSIACGSKRDCSSSNWNWITCIFVATAVEDSLSVKPNNFHLLMLRILLIK